VFHKKDSHLLFGIWPDYFPAVQFSRAPEALKQYVRQRTTNRLAQSNP
jgi:hypothetical protein